MIFIAKFMNHRLKEVEKMNNSKNDRARVTRGTLKTAGRLMKYVFGYYKVPFIVVIICILLSSVSTISVSLSLRFLLDDYIIPLIGNANPDFTELYKALTLLACIFLMGVIASFVYSRMMVVIGQGVLKRVRDEMFEHMQTLPIRYFDQNTNGSIMSLYTNDTDTLRQMINQSIPQVLMSSFTIVVTFISMLALSPILTLLAVVVIFLMILIAKFVGGNSGKYFIRQQVDLANITGYVEEHMNGQRVIKVFNHEAKTKEEFDALNEKLYESASTAHTFASMMGPIIGNMGNLQFVLTAVFGGVLSVLGIGGITLGIMASYLQFTRSFTQPFMQIAQQFNSIIMALAGAERIFHMIDEEPETDDGYVTLVNAKWNSDGTLTECPDRTGIWAWKHPHQADGTVTYTELKGDVRFFDMSFGYTPDHMVLHNLSLYAKPGQKLAFVGSTGAGKTTITNLINRFYDVQDGKIRYDGININKIKKADLRHSLGIVLQDTHLFTGTIKENIRYGKLDATDGEVYAAAKLAHADQFIQMLPNGYDTMLTSDGEELSQGQRQLLAIARAAIADPPVLILDEATSSIDTRTERIVQEGMDNLMKGRTVFVIAHRLSTIRNSDAIMVLEHGRIIERGTHKELLALKGTYYQLYTGKLELD
jgi:ATP-binding cassette subfamily B multidrug efflux pump